MNSGIAKVIAFFVLASVCLCANWQSYGNFTSDNITFIKTTLDNGLSRVATSSLSEYLLPTVISDALNTAWSQAWNVVVVGTADPLNDVVLYGYAFRSHWIWLNNYGTTKRSYVIWKDYNCQSWADIS